MTKLNKKRLFVRSRLNHHHVCVYTGWVLGGCLHSDYCDYRCMCMNISTRWFIQLQCVCVARSLKVQLHIYKMFAFLTLRLKLDHLSLWIIQFTFNFLFTVYWSKACLEHYCISAYCISSFHFFPWQRLAPCTEGPFHGRTHQMRIQINLSGRVWPTHYWRFH